MAIIDVVLVGIGLVVSYVIADKIRTHLKTDSEYAHLWDKLILKAKNANIR